MPSRPFLTSPAGLRSAGFVQLLVLVSLAGIGAIVTASLGLASVNNQAAAALERTVETEALAASAFTRLSHAIADPSDDLELVVLDVEVPLNFGRGAVGLKIESEASKVNLMLADLALLRRYVTNAGLSSDDANAVVEALDQARGAGDRRWAIDTLLVALDGLRSHSDLLEDVSVFSTTAGIDPAYATSRTPASIPDLSTAQLAQLRTAAPSGPCEDCRVHVLLARRQ